MNKHLVKSLMIAGTFAISTFSANALEGGDATKGEKTFKKCMACHTIGEGAKNKVGPVLTGVIGRKAGSFEGYKYGKHLAELGETGLIWNEDEVFEYLKDPKKYLRAKLDNKKAKTKMSFKLKKEEERKDVIAYLKTFSPEAEESAAESTEEEAATTTEGTTSNQIMSQDLGQGDTLARQLGILFTRAFDIRLKQRGQQIHESSICDPCFVVKGL